MARLTWLATQAAAAARAPAAVPDATLALGPVVGAIACTVRPGRLSRKASDPARASTSARATATLTPRRRRVRRGGRANSGGPAGAFGGAAGAFGGAAGAFGTAAGAFGTAAGAFGGADCGGAD